MSSAKALQSNIWKYGLFLITNRRSYWPILTVYFLVSPDNTLQQIGFFMAIGQVFGVLLEVPSGYISDKIGHKKALIISKVGLVFSTVFYLIGGNFWFFVLGSSFFSISIAFQSGTIEAFMQETLIGLGRGEEYSKVIGKIKSISLIVTAVFLATIPALVAFNIRWPFLVVLVLDLAGLLVVFSFVVPERAKVAIEEIGAGNFRQVLGEAKKYNFIPVIIFSALMTGILMGTGVFRDVYQQFLGIPIVYLGVLLALSRVVASLVSRVIYRLKSLVDINGYFILQMLFFFPLIFLLGVVSNKWVIAALFIVIIGTLWGKGPLSTHYKLEYIKQSNFKATLLSLGGLLKNLSFGGSSLLSGYLIGTYFYQTGYLLYAGWTLVLILMAYFYFLGSRRAPRANH